MSLGHGASPVKNGLVFHYDMANTGKSWKGAPYKNELVATGWSGDGSNQTAFVKSTTLITDTKLKFRGLPTYLWAPGSSLNGYLNGTEDLNYSSTSAEWTFSCFIKRDDGAPITSLNVYMYYPSSDGAAAGTIQDMGDGWYRVFRIRTGTVNYLGLVGFTGFSANHKYYLSGAMLTKTQFPVYPVDPGVTRTNTEAIVDLTKNNTITATNLTYNVDGSFKFDGSTNYIALPNTQIVGSTNGTISTIIEIPSAASDYDAIFSCETGPDWYNLRTWLSMYGSNQIRFSIGNTTASTQNDCVSSVLQYNTPYMITATYDGSSAKIYINGNLDRSISTTIVPGIFTPTLVRIGHHYSTRYFLGTIYSLKIYNRTLSDLEVAQNFEASRGRYGI